MPDYGHDLTFGVFVTPTSQRPDEAVGLAQRAERVGLDLATFQDHPYNPGLLDTWTLLSWVAARTDRLRVSGDVLSLPLRQPAVLARAAASLDLLSGGRFELGLGAGAIWDAIEAMGVRRLSPGEAVDALGEAIDVIRGIWDVSQRGGVRVDGAHYRVRGAKRGPEAAHDISIWLGAYKPRMLRLTGAKADGWLPSLPYLKDGDLARGNRIVDEAAAEAGRDPREIRRLLNVNGAFRTTSAGFLQGPPEQWLDELLPLALEDGVSTFVVGAEDPSTIELWGREVAPALRERVAAERASAGTPVGEEVRGPKALALRREGVDYDAMPSSLRRTAVEPGDRGYGKVRSTYVRSGSPALVLRPENADEVAEALSFARDQGVPLAVRSGGHGISGRSTGDGDIVVDLGRIDEIQVLDRASGRIRLGPGARWGHVVGLNCIRGPATMLPLLEEIVSAVDVPVAALPVPYRTSEQEPSFQSLRDPADQSTRSGIPFPTALDPFTCTRHEIADFTDKAKELGVRYFGLCCGAGPHHVRSMAEALGRTPPASRYSADMSKHAFLGSDTNLQRHNLEYRDQL